MAAKEMRHLQLRHEYSRAQWRGRQDAGATSWDSDWDGESDSDSDGDWDGDGEW